MSIPITAFFVADFTQAAARRHMVGIAVQRIGDNKIEILPRGLVQGAVADNRPSTVLKQVVVGEQHGLAHFFRPVHHSSLTVETPPFRAVG
ncbi:MAG: hypothetical protein Q3966_01245, partial [Neisseria sp.]|nr:hypothetical protein [Neisseria sp.]